MEPEASAVSEPLIAVTAVPIRVEEAAAAAAAHHTPGGFRELYKDGPDTHYKAAGGAYRNPHESSVIKALHEALATFRLVRVESRVAEQGVSPVVVPLTADSPILDLAAGSGEVTIALNALGFTRVTGCDPYTQAAFEARVGRPAESWSFQDIAGGVLSDVEGGYSLAVCSYALHLVEPSWLYGVMTSLAAACDFLMIISPHKKPDLGLNPSGYGWALVAPGELRVDRVHVRLLKSLLR